MKQLRVGVIGCGMVAHVGHLPFLDKNPQCRISALADPDRRNLRRTQRKYGVAHTFEEIGHERAEMISRLQHIAEMSRLDFA